MKTTTLFRRDFNLVILGQIISLFGNAALRLALPLYLLDQTGSATLYGGVSACAFVPMILMSPVGGAAADRLPKAKMMAVLDFITCAVTVGICLGLKQAPLVPLLLVGLMLLYGIQGAYQPSVQASMPLLAAPEQLVTANAAINLVASLSSLLGPVLGSVVYTQFGLEPVLWISAACFLVSAVMELFIRIPHTPRAMQASLWKTVSSEIGESLSFLFREQPVLAKGTLVVCAFNLLLSAMLLVGMPVVITQRLGLSGQLYGVAQGALAAGGLLGGLAAASLGTRLTHKICPQLLLASAGAAVVMAVPLALRCPPLVCYAVILISAVVMMLLSTLFTIVMMAFIQALTPGHLVGKVMACVMSLAMCASPLGQALYGVLFQYLPAWGVMVAGGLASCVVAIATRRIFWRLGADV